MTQKTKEWYEIAAMDFGIAKHLEAKHVKEATRFTDEILQWVKSIIYATEKSDIMIFPTMKTLDK